MRSHVQVQRTVAGCFAVLWQLRSIRRSVPSSVFQTLRSSPSCCPGWITVMLLNRLQSVLNAAARSVAGLRRSDHITDTLASCHWLRAPERITFKLAVTVYRGIHGTAPRYFSHVLYRVSDITSRRRLRSSTSSELVIPTLRLVTVGDRRLICFGNLIRTLYLGGCVACCAQ